MFNKQYYTDKLAKLQVKNNQVLQEYINVGVKFGQDITYLNSELLETKQLLDEATIKEEPKEDDKITNI